jgi:hypothetical protein
MTAVINWGGLLLMVALTIYGVIGLKSGRVKAMGNSREIY